VAEAASSSPSTSSSPSSSATPSPPTYPDDGYSYVIKFEGYEEKETVSSRRLRPVARRAVDVKDVKPETVYLVNANMESPELRGFWYDFYVQPRDTSKKKRGPSLRELEGWLFAGSDRIPVETKLVVRERVLELEKVGEAKRIYRDGRDGSPAVPESRPVGPECDECKGNEKRKCKKCGCSKCGGKQEPDKQIICDECEDAFHLWCLNPPLQQMPEDDEWFCPECRNDKSEIVQAGEGLKASKKKANMPSGKGNTTRDWGKGMATQGVNKKCSVVASDHFGPIPGVEVGTNWRFRLGCCESGVHRPPVAGIAGKASLGSQSVVLSGGYEDDEDNGDEFYYTGAGGRDLSGNKRTAEQSCDQSLTMTNLALAVNCAAKVNQEGADAGDDWRKGKPLRVVRNYKGAKHSKYAPKEGNRYDGIYKVVKYWKEKGKSGFSIWRYLMRRDDPNPAPWTPAGKKKIQELGIQEMIVPEGYEETQRAKEEKKNLEKEEKEKEREKTKEKRKSKGGKEAENEGQSAKKNKRKRKISSSDDDDGEEEKENSPNSKKARKSSASDNVVIAYKPPKDVAELITADALNSKLWDEVKSAGVKGKPVFSAKLTEIFLCVCCQDVVQQPVTTPCGHNACLDCLKMSFECGVKSCPVCRGELNDQDVKKVNDNLAKALKTLLPGYGR